METKIIDGLALSKQVYVDLKNRIRKLKNIGITPGLAVILVGESSASQIYVRNKVKACEKIGIISKQENYQENIVESELLNHIYRLNKDTSINGILVQLPLPKHIDTHKVIEAIDHNKDVDGFNVINAGLLMTGNPLFCPCTPYGIMQILKNENINIRGSEAVIVGASNIVGKPIAMLMLQAGATVTICNSKTKDLKSHTKRADILIVAVGKPGMINGSMIKPGAVLIDVGINRGLDNKICGDIDLPSVKDIAGYITPVPGGVGPMTIAMLLTNTVESAERSIKDQ
ncbi:bifunctional methylenetetrahydrofolate dehydrogenase/methenyltetrahydrofolate cyclohydrolase FolD [Candidatus Kinetoplastidibacterium galati]|uniref:Bifunctional protein FolD n=1 Tax=Candidatus Kinetoplastidibacterium galati TCC219 TaxID=1208921 RepID=M1LY54_9PROT|nr:bifunctional methylenetetrahydrofolate dehydrogenase/methenyltetrahydrofolate cyclohydrolase FolD [Candidatus Kinetoplastibacterium galatii]AGF49006.1 methylenetetrahydrofolate dehydrogenase (NADP+) [Candidatus Kinetoplastibacterium galatii TCC219]